MRTGNDFAILTAEQLFLFLRRLQTQLFSSSKNAGLPFDIPASTALWILKNRRDRYYLFNNPFGLLFVYYTVPFRTYIYSITRLFILSRGFAVFVRTLFFYCTILYYFAFFLKYLAAYPSHPVKAQAITLLNVIVIINYLNDSTLFIKRRTNADFGIIT